MSNDESHAEFHNAHSRYGPNDPENIVSFFVSVFNMVQFMHRPVSSCHIVEVSINDIMLNNNMLPENNGHPFLYTLFSMRRQIHRKTSRDRGRNTQDRDDLADRRLLLRILLYA